MLSVHTYSNPDLFKAESIVSGVERYLAAKKTIGLNFDNVDIFIYLTALLEMEKIYFDNHPSQTSLLLSHAHSLQMTPELKERLVQYIDHLKKDIPDSLKITKFTPNYRQGIDLRPYLLFGLEEYLQTL